MRMISMPVLLLLLTACTESAVPDVSAQLDPMAEQYVRLALALGEHDADYVDAYFGPEDWREAAHSNSRDLADIAAEATQVAQQVRAIDTSGAEFLLRLRQDYIASHLESLATIAQMRDGAVLSFDEESQRVYGFVAPTFSQQFYDTVLAEIDAMLPGDKPLYERVNDFRQQFQVPADRLEAVTRAAIEECRARTLQHVELPEGESYRLEMVSGNPWGAYNWYEGNAQSLVQMETSRPAYLTSATRIGCHEGYPGHHTLSSLLDENFLQARGWIEFSVLPLFSPQGIIFEGSGDLAERVAFPGDSRNEFLRDILLPLAGIDEVDFETNERLESAIDKMRYADIEAARHYLDGDWDRAETEDWITKYALIAPERIDSWFAFTERYRSYRINYVLGEDLVAAYVQRENPDADVEGNWLALQKLLSYPPAPMLVADAE